MTIHRRPQIRFTDAPQGRCRWCGEDILFESGDKAGEVNKRRRWHRECVDVYNASDPREARRRIRKRDRGRCAHCRVDTYKVRREFLAIKRGRAKAIREQGYKPGKSFWELDHIVPLIDGGSHDDINLQTLCAPCHSVKTADEARSRSQRSREQQAEQHATSLPPNVEPEIVMNTSAQRSNSTARAAKKVRPKTLDELLAAADAVNARVKQVLQSPDHRSSRTTSTPTA